jgi:hypothetical protein
MESEGPLPCSQEPATGPYPEPDEKYVFWETILLEANVESPMYGTRKSVY